VFAVVRIEDDAMDLEDRITVKEIVSSEEEAIAEVERLNAIRSEDSYRYFWQATRHVGTVKSTG